MRVARWIEDEREEVQSLRQSVVTATEPELLLHGHWHRRHHEHIRPVGTEVFSLKHDGQRGWLAVLDLEGLEAVWAKPEDWRGEAPRDPLETDH